MDTPFPYAQYVTGKHFIGRKADVTLLGNLLSQGEHVAIYEPPKSGKTSLIQQALYTMRLGGRAFTVGQFSALNIRTPEDFLLRLGATVLKMVAFTTDEIRNLVQRYLAGTHFVFDPVAYSERNQVISLNWELDGEDVLAMLRLPFRVAADRGDRMIMILDDFQCLSYLDNPDVILRPLDAVLREEQARKLFSFVFCGSAVNAMKTLFEGSRLFSRVVARVRLSPIDEHEIVDHVQRGFLSSGKVLNQDLVVGTCRLFKGNVWYINQFASICDTMSRGYIMEPMLVDALNCLIAIHEPQFVSIVSNLTTHQISLLRATIEGSIRFSSADIIRKYGLNSSANVKRVKDALMKKEVLTFDENDVPSLEDPLFEYWVKKYYFELPA